MSDPNRNDSGGVGGTNTSQPIVKKRSIDDIIDHMTADLQYEGQYMLLGSPPAAATAPVTSSAPGQHSWTEYSNSANSSPIFLQQQNQQFVDVQPDTRQQLCRGLFYDGISPTRIQELSPTGGEMIGMVDMGNGNFVNVVFNPSAATRSNQLHHQLSNSAAATAQQQHDPFYVHHQQLHQQNHQNQQLHQPNQQLHQQNLQSPQQILQQNQLVHQNQQLHQQNLQQPQQMHQNQQLHHQNPQLHQQNPQLHQNPQQLQHQNPQMHQQNQQLHQQNPQLHQQNQQLQQQNQQLHQQNPQLHQQNQQLHHGSSIASPSQPASTNQVHANEYGLFTAPSGGKPVIPLQANQQLIENLVGNWLPNQSGTYSPFGCGKSSVQNAAAENGIDDSSSLRSQPQPTTAPQPQPAAGRKPRAVAEVRPMRPTYSDVLTKSPPSTASKSTAAAAQGSGSATAAAAAAAAKNEGRKQGGKGGKSGSKDSQQSKLGSTLRRQHSSGSDDAGGGLLGGKGGGGGGNSSFCQSSGVGASAGSKRWASIENLAPAHHGGSPVDAGYEAQETGGKKGGSAAAGKVGGKKKGVKASVNDDKNEPLNNHKVNNATLTGNKRPLQINNNIQRNRANIEKNVFKSAKKGVNGNGKEESKSNSSPLSSTKRVQRSGKRRQGNTYIDMIWTKWQHYMKLFAHWLLNLVWDVMALSTRLLVHLCQVSLDYSAATMRCGWRRVGDMLGRGGNRLGGGLGGRGAKSTSTPGDTSSTRSWWKFWRRRSPAGEGGGSPGKQARADKQPPHEGLANNMALPTTGDDAIKRLLSCKGKDPYSILGVTKKCNDEEIKKYYKKQAVLVHPDKNSQPGAEEAFKILVHAFELIGEPERRSRYDQCVAETHQMEHAWTELNDLLTRLHQKMEYTANTLRCTNCGKRHRRVQVKRPVYAARFCAQCKIHHSARESSTNGGSAMSAGDTSASRQRRKTKRKK
ncbi:hypothetical protein LSTR_LSTR012625 [Laodelphax striatellus]|uniref:J domain-containing protein n=1 Tax=Laodelphax striatellus TaxID=195883 RepID=A0A482WNP4_LAOST|nr:hypothetical protein LSTR_LSTR012625 [Laodelphax striatellus]